MAALTARVVRKFVGEQEEISVPVAVSDIYYAGGVLMFDDDGYGAVPADSAAMFAAGINTGIYGDGDRVDAKTVGASDHPRAIVKRGKVWLPFASVAETDRGEIAYISDDAGTLTQTAGSKTVGYVILDVDTTNELALVDLRVPDRIA